MTQESQPDGARAASSNRPLEDELQPGLTTASRNPSAKPAAPKKQEIDLKVLALKEMLAERQLHHSRAVDSNPEPVTTPSIRKRAHRIFKRWHPRLGIELDPSKEAPIVRTVWPVFFFREQVACPD